MILASHQPDFAPYPGFFYKMLMSDVFVLSTDVGYSNSEMHKYNYIQGSDGRQRIGLPIVGHQEGKPLRDILISRDNRLIYKAAKTFEQTYKHHPYFGKYGRHILNIIVSATTPYGERLADINKSLILYIANGFGFDCDILDASRMNLKGRRDERLIDMCEKTGCNLYLSGWGAAAYHDPKLYEDHGLRLTYTDYRPIVYEQYGNKGDFIENLSMLDYVMNCGFQMPSEWR